MLNLLPHDILVCISQHFYTEEACIVRLVCRDTSKITKPACTHSRAFLQLQDRLEACTNNDFVCDEFNKASDLFDTFFDLCTCRQNAFITDYGVWLWYQTSKLQLCSETCEDVMYKLAALQSEACFVCECLLQYCSATHLLSHWTHWNRAARQILKIA